MGKRKRKGSVAWRKAILDARVKVKDKGDHFETASGKLITWSSKDAYAAQLMLKGKARKRR